jgi:hypothetical protein
MTTHQVAPLPYLRRRYLPGGDVLTKAPGRLGVWAVMALAVSSIGLGMVQSTLAAQDARQRDQLVQTVTRACAQERAPADVCAAGVRAGQ